MEVDEAATPVDILFTFDEKEYAFRLGDVVFYVMAVTAHVEVLHGVGVNPNEIEVLDCIVYSLFREVNRPSWVRKTCWFHSML